MPLERKKYVFDSVHGNIDLTEVEKGIIDTWVFQRLRRIRQLGTAEFVYPGATHSRFAHSLGAMFVMDQYLNNVKKDGQPIAENDEMIQKLRLAALLHDIGHYPFSHATETMIRKEFGGLRHEEHGFQIVRDFLEDRLDPYSAEEIVDILGGV